MTHVLRWTSPWGFTVLGLAMTGLMACNSGSGSDTTTVEANAAQHEEEHEGHHEEGEAAEDRGHGGEDEHGHEGEDHHGEEGVVRLTPEQMAASGIKVVAAGSSFIDAGVELLGEVVPNGDEIAHIFPRFAGLVLEVKKTVGDQVRRGDVLAVLESSESLSAYPIKTLIDGVVLQKEIARGESVDRDKLCFVVADLDTVWIELRVYQRDLGAVRVGRKVRIVLGEDGPSDEAAIAYVTPSVDAATRTATARIVLPNTEGLWRPGMFVTARAIDEAVANVVVPRSALQVVEGQPSVFVQTEEGWIARAVRLGREGEKSVEILAGVSAGEKIAAENAFLLKAELGKGEAEHEH